MARTARAVAVDTPHHATPRGSGRQDGLLTDRDRKVYLNTFVDYAERYSLRVWGSCLMTNHVHFVVVLEGERSLARVFERTTHTRRFRAIRESATHGRRQWRTAWSTL